MRTESAVQVVNAPPGVGVMDVVVGVIILWVVPLFVAHAIGKPKNRSGFLYGFSLGLAGRGHPGRAAVPKKWHPPFE